MKHKITTEVLREINRIAKALPKMHFKDKKIRKAMTGQKLLENGIFKVGGEAVKRDKWYSAEFPAEVNHAKEMKKLYEQKGKDAVLNYGNEILKMAIINSNGKTHTTPKQGDSPAAVPAGHDPGQTAAGAEDHPRADAKQHGADIPRSELINKGLERY